MRNVRRRWGTRSGSPLARARYRAAGIASTSLIGFLLLAVPIVHAQDLDVEPPLIEHERIERGESAEPQPFTATVVDDRELAEVLLFHRRAGEEAFEKVPFERVGDSTVFLVTLPADANDRRAIEYYIQARDAAGNRVIRGYAFNPLQREMGRAESVAGATSEAGSGGFNRNWLWVGLGVLAVGAVVAMSDSGGEDGSEDTFTVTIEPPG